MRKEWEEYQAIYVHIPFCVQKCLYCDFASYANCTHQVKERYVAALCREIAYPLSLPVAEQATIYFGGGTPSTLTVEEIAKIVAALKAKGLWRNPKEATIEVNPGTVDVEKLKAFKGLGFTRISMGVQSLNDTELKAIGRIHTAEQALEAIAMAQKAGFEHINADVIYGLPQQSLETLKATLSGLLATAIDHISVYGLIVEEGTPLEKLLEENKISLPDEDMAADMYDFVQEFLGQKGFLRYEISNYARRGKESQRLVDTGYSRHNDVYWRYLPYAAFGASAASFDGLNRYTRPENIEEYIAFTQSLGETCYEAIAEPLDAAEGLSEYLMMGLRRSAGVDLAMAKERYGVDVLQRYGRELQPYMDLQLVGYDGETASLFLTSKGMAVGNQIFEIFV
ncbi:MAG: radical SAM family heme chaperone HemW [Phascolarctobacterium sp.]|nr:radical SAM family heme chaperone HemW [Phascolarctobacterium sp.]